MSALVWFAQSNAPLAGKALGYAFISTHGIQRLLQVLGVPLDADEKTIKQTFRKLARQYHPDINPGNKQAEPKSKEISEAYTVLSDPEQRKKYDQMRGDYQGYQQTGGCPPEYNWDTCRLNPMRDRAVNTQPLKT